MGVSSIFTNTCLEANFQFHLKKIIVIYLKILSFIISNLFQVLNVQGMYSIYHRQDSLWDLQLLKYL